MKFLLAILVTLSLSLVGHAQVWQTIDGPNPRPMVKALYEVNSYVVANGTCSLFSSADQGASYEPLRPGHHNTSVYTIYNGKAYLAESDLDVIENSWGNWSFSSQTHWHISDLNSSSNRIYMATEEGAKLSVNGTFWFDINNGLPIWWSYFMTGPTTVDSAMYHSSNSICANNTNLFAATDSGVYRSPVDGSSWQPVNTGLPIAVFDHVRCSGDTIFASSQNDIYRSIDNGASWNLSWSLGASNQINRLKILNDSVFVLTMEEGLVYSGDFGANWTTANTNLELLEVWDISFINGEYHLAGAQGISKGFDNWLSSDFGVVCSYAPTMLESQDGIVAVSNADVYYLGDDSTSWINTTKDISIWKGTSIAMVNDYLVFSLDPDTLYDSLNRNYMSPDNGVTWSSLSQMGPYGPYNVASNGTLISANYQDSVYVSNDGGYNWDLIAGLPPSGNFCSGNAPVFFGQNYWFVRGCDDVGRLSRSNDNGATWENVDLNIWWGGTLNGLWEFGDTLFAAALWGLHYSTDDGVTWDYCGHGLPEVWSTGASRIFGMVQWHGNLYLSMGDFVYVSFNNGLTFEIISEGLPVTGSSGPLTGTNLVLRNDTLYFGSTSYGIYSMDLLALEPFLNVNEQYSVVDLSIYPNPSDGVITVSLEEQVQDVELGIYTLSGQLIRSDDFDQFKEEAIDLSGLKGAYLLKLSSADFTTVERIVLQ